MGLDADLKLTPAGDGEWTATVGEEWWTPRGPLGGYVMAFVMRAMELAVADPERQPRSATMHFLRAPGRGPSRRSRPRSSARGARCRASACRLEQDGKLIGLALGAYSTRLGGPAARRLADARGRAAGRVDAAARCGRTRPSRRRSWTGWTCSTASATPPFSGSEHAQTGGWLGLREERPIDAADDRDPRRRLVPGAVAAAAGSSPPAPTIDLTIHFRAPLPLDGRLLLGRFDSKLVRDGFFDEDGELWAPDGTLVAQSRQLGLLLGAEA